MVSEGNSDSTKIQHFDDLLLKIVEDTLTEIFGEKAVKNMIRTMEENYSLKWKEIPRRPNDFMDVLQKILGTGSIIIEDLIIEALYSNLGLEFKRKRGYSFSNYVEEARIFGLVKRK